MAVEPLEPDQDAYGAAIRAEHEGRRSFEIVERDDGYAGVSGHPSVYFTTYEEWTDPVRHAIDEVEGRVLDVGCGAGRHALHLQLAGHDVVGIDRSPGAIEVARDRGLEEAHVMDVTDVGELSESFEALLLFGNNFGLLGTQDRAPSVLAAFDELTTDSAKIYAQSTDPHETSDPAHLSYHAFNERRGRLPGALRIRIRFKKRATPWFDYLLVAPNEMREVLAGTPWAVETIRRGENGRYVAILEKR